MVEPGGSPQWAGSCSIRMHHPPTCRSRGRQAKSDQAMASGSLPSQQVSFSQRVGLPVRRDEAAGRSFLSDGRGRRIKAKKTYKFTENVILKAVLLYKGMAGSGIFAGAGMIPSACKYLPTCSDYMTESVRKYGLRRGLFLGIKRLGSCTPLAAGKWDPVP